MPDFEAKCVFTLCLIWFAGALHVFCAVYIMEPDAGGLIELKNTVFGTLFRGNEEGSFLLKLASTIMFIGWIFGAFFLSRLSDRNGRRVALLISVLVVTLGSLLQMFAIRYWIFLVGRFIVGSGVGGMGVCTYVWGCEWTLDSMNSHADSQYISENDSKKAINFRVAASYQISWALGAACLPGIIVLFPFWRSFLAVVLLITVMSALLVFATVPESPHWLHSKRTAASSLLFDTDDAVVLTSCEANDEIEKVNDSFSTRFPLRLILQFVVLMLVWFSTSFVYYGLSLNTNQLPGNIFILGFLVNLSSIPGQLVGAPLDRALGRRKAFVLTILGCTVCFLVMTLSTLFGIHGNLVIPIASIIGQFFAALQYSFCYLTTASLFITSIRASGVGICVTVARFGALLSPLVTLIGKNSVGYPPFLIMFGTSLLTAVLTAVILDMRPNLFK